MVYGVFCSDVRGKGWNQIVQVGTMKLELEVMYSSDSSSSSFSSVQKRFVVQEVEEMSNRIELKINMPFRALSIMKRHIMAHLPLNVPLSSQVRLVLPFVITNTIHFWSSFGSWSSVLGLIHTRWIPLVESNSSAGDRSIDP